jgi:hypothetical protein
VAIGAAGQVRAACVGRREAEVGGAF